MGTLYDCICNLPLGSRAFIYVYIDNQLCAMFVCLEVAPGFIRFSTHHEINVNFETYYNILTDFRSACNGAYPKLISKIEVKSYYKCKDIIHSVFIKKLYNVNSTIQYILYDIDESHIPRRCDDCHVFETRETMDHITYEYFRIFYFYLKRFKYLII